MTSIFSSTPGLVLAVAGAAVAVTLLLIFMLPHAARYRRGSDSAASSAASSIGGGGGRRERSRSRSRDRSSSAPLGSPGTRARGRGRPGAPTEDATFGAGTGVGAGARAGVGEAADGAGADAPHGGGGGGGARDGDDDDEGSEELEGSVALSFSAAALSRSWTQCPYDELVAQRGGVEALLGEVRARPPGAPDGGELLRELGLRLRALGVADPAFEQTLPRPGTRVVVVQALCPLYSQYIGGPGGAQTLSGCFMNELELASGMRLVHCNISPMCWRKSDGDGVEHTGSSAGCIDPAGDTLAVLSAVKEIFFLGLIISGLVIDAFLVASNASIASFVGKAAASKATYFVPYRSERFGGLPVFCAPHPKFAAAAFLRNTTAIARRLNVLSGDRVAVASLVVEGYSKVLASARPDASAAAVAAETERIYEAVRASSPAKAAGIIVRKWSMRLNEEADEETAEHFKEAQRVQTSSAGMAQAKKASSFRELLAKAGLR